MEHFEDDDDKITSMLAARRFVFFDFELESLLVPGQVECDSPDAIEEQQRADRHQPNAQSWVAVVDYNSAKKESRRQQDRSPNQGGGNRRSNLETLDAPRGQTGGDINERESGPMRVGEREHEPSRFISNIDVPADFEAVQGFECVAER
jgi:hypothetical protein